jgi:miniconductance mechanosensitive channel
MFSSFIFDPFLISLLSLAGLVFVALLSNFLMRKVVLRLLDRLISFTDFAADLRKHNFVARLVHAVPGWIIIQGLPLIPNLPIELVRPVSNVAVAYVILTLVLAASTVIDAVNSIYTKKGFAATKPIKGYLTALKIVIFVVAALLGIAALIDKSPLILFSGLGAMAAILILVFQDTLLSFVASLQISSSQMIKVGDWVQVPKLDIDGVVVDIALYHITVRNWDMTVTTVPLRKFVGEPFKNWRGMHEAGVRRVKRSVMIDQETVYFLNSSLIRKMRADAVIGQFVKTMEEDGTIETNLALLRGYMIRYLTKHPGVDLNQRLMVRTTEPTTSGIPLEIYCFTKTTDGDPYEKFQSELFDHILAVLPKFGLKVFQAR